MTNFEFEAQKIVYDNLIKNSTLMTLVSNRIYDEPSDNLAYPYIIIGDGGSKPHLRHNGDGLDSYFLITIFTNPEDLGWYPAEEIASQIKSTLHLKTFICFDTSIKNVITKEESLTRKREGPYRNIELNYRVLLESV